MLAPHLTLESHGELLDAARHRSKREVEHLIAMIRPQAPVPASVRKLPSPVRVSSAPHRATPSDTPYVAEAPPRPPAPMPAQFPAARPAVILPLALERYHVRFRVGADTFEKLRRVQDLLRHRVPNGDVAVVFDRALTVLLEHLEKTKVATTEHPRACRAHARGSRHIPAAVRRQVWARGEGRCAFVGACGRCTERGFLEFHHVRPYAAGGQAVAANIELRCRAHNQYEADLLVPGQAPPVVREGSSVYGAANSVRTEWYGAQPRDEQARGASVSCHAGRASCDVLEWRREALFMT